MAGELTEEQIRNLAGTTGAMQGGVEELSKVPTGPSPQTIANLTWEGNLLNTADSLLNNYYEENPLTAKAVETSATVADTIPVNPVDSSGLIPFLKDTVKKARNGKLGPIGTGAVTIAQNALGNANNYRNAFETMMYNLGAETTEDGKTILNPKISPISDRNIRKKIIETSDFVQENMRGILDNAFLQLNIAKDFIGIPRNELDLEENEMGNTLRLLANDKKRYNLTEEIAGKYSGVGINPNQY